MVVDVTFPGTPWDGISDVPLACGQGLDVQPDDDTWEQSSR